MLAAVTSPTTFNTAYSSLSHSSSCYLYTLGGKQAPFANHSGSFPVLFPLCHDAQLDCPPHQCRQLWELVFALLDQQSLINCTEFGTPSMILTYFTPSYQTKKFRVRFAVDKYLHASTQSSRTGEKPKFLWPASGSWKPDSLKNLTEEGSFK